MVPFSHHDCSMKLYAFIRIFSVFIDKSKAFTCKMAAIPYGGEQVNLMHISYRNMCPWCTYPGDGYGSRIYCGLGNFRH